jgi:hypothetical protein
MCEARDDTCGRKNMHEFTHLRLSNGIVNNSLLTTGSLHRTALRPLADRCRTRDVGGMTG